MECWMYCLLAISLISVGCTVIEMATGKPPWSQQYKEINFFQVAALFYIGTTKSHPPIPEHLSLEAKDFLLKCLQDPSRICNCGLKDEDGFLMDKLHHASEGRGSGGKVQARVQETLKKHYLTKAFAMKEQVWFVGDCNGAGAGAHTNYSTKSMRANGGIDVIIKAIEKLRLRHKEHISAYGEGQREKINNAP